jgi:hypothetical protein
LGGEDDDIEVVDDEVVDEGRLGIVIGRRGWCGGFGGMKLMAGDGRLERLVAFDELQEGATVEFEMENGDRGPSAKNVKLAE